MWYSIKAGIVFGPKVDIPEILLYANCIAKHIREFASPDICHDPRNVLNWGWSIAESRVQLLTNPARVRRVIKKAYGAPATRSRLGRFRVTAV